MRRKSNHTRNRSYMKRIRKQREKQKEKAGARIKKTLALISILAQALKILEKINN